MPRKRSRWSRSRSRMLARSSARDQNSASSLTATERTWLREDDGQRLPTADRRGGRHAGVRLVDLPVGEAVEHLVEGNASFQPCERRAEAVVQAVPEREV